MRPRLILLAFSVLIAATAHAQTGPAGIQSPSKNIACQHFNYDKQNTLRSLARAKQEVF
jgi:hypothetical protein